MYTFIYNCSLRKNIELVLNSEPSSKCYRPNSNDENHDVRFNKNIERLYR